MVDQQSSIRLGDHHALLLEADDAYRATMAECLRLGGCSTDQVATLDSAFAALDDRKYDLVVWGGAAADVRHHGGAAAGVRARTKAPLLVVDGGFDAPEVAIAVRAEHWLPKPFVPGALVDAVRSALRTPAESEALRQWHELSPAKRRWSAAGGLTGNGKRLAAASSQADDVTLFGPDGGSGRGCDAVGSQLRLAAGRIRSSATQRVLAEHVSGDLACTVEIVCCEEMVDGSSGTRMVELRVTKVYRREGREWKVVHRHADPLVAQHAFLLAEATSPAGC